MAFKVKGTSAKSISPVKRQKATDSQRAKVLMVLKRHIDVGSGVPNYDSDWQDYMLMGAISVPSYINWRGGAKVDGYLEAHDSGVRRRKGTIAKFGNGPLKLSHRFGEKNWESFVKLGAEAQDVLLAKWGLIAIKESISPANPPAMPNRPNPTTPTNPREETDDNTTISDGIAQAKLKKTGKVVK